MLTFLILINSYQSLIEALNNSKIIFLSLLLFSGLGKLRPTKEIFFTCVLAKKQIVLS